MTDKALNLLRFAAKAGKLSFGTHATLFALEKGKTKLVCAANDISAKSVKELNFYAFKVNAKVFILKSTNTEALSQALGKRCGIVAVNDDGFKEAILKTGGTAHDGEI